MFNKRPKQSGIYRIKDNIDKLKLKIQLRHVNSLLQLPSYTITANGLAFDGNEFNNSATENTLTTVHIKWQQKLLSAKEVELYKNPNNCLTVAQKKYNEWINAKKTSENAGDVSKRSKGKLKKRNKKQTTNVNDHKNEIFTYVQADNFKSSEQDLNNSEYMYIYAALCPETELVALKWLPQQRLLQIYPDFNDMQSNPYFIEIDSDYRHLYAYAVTNISKSRLNFHNEYNIISPILSIGKTHWQLDQDLHEQFEMPPKRMKRFTLLFEIRSACTAAAYQPLHLRFQAHLPEHCLLEEGPAAAATHASFASSCHQTCSIATHICAQSFFFGYSFQLTLLCEEAFQEHDLLHIYFELISIDSWERERVEGYAHFSTYLIAGSEEQTLPCLRPVGSLLDALTRYFIGGRRKFNYVNFFTPNKNVENLLHTRSQCHMINTGHLHTVCQRLVQRNCELLSPCKSRCSGMTLDDIMKAFIQARKRLEMHVLQNRAD